MTVKPVRGRCARCRRGGLRLYPTVNHSMSRMMFLCSPCRQVDGGRGTPESYRYTADQINKRMAEMRGWLAEIDAARRGVAPDTRPTWERSQ